MRRGTNQYRDKHKTNIHYVGWFLFVVALAVTISLPFRMREIERAYAQQSIISPLPIEKPLESTPSAKLVPSNDELVGKIEAYIKTIFGREGKMAIEVQHHECSPNRREYPKCEKNDNIEWSCGLWQINLRDPKTLRVIHANKIPGDTFEEKCEKLKDDPYFSTLIAYKIKEDWNGFCAWTWYKNNYCK